MKNPHVAVIGKLNLSGNIIPTIWWQRLRLESGAVDYVSVMILAEIIYWFKPTIVRNEDTGLILEIKQKFRADKLQRSYQSFADQFGLSKKQVREAFQRLTDRELITTEFRIITVNNTPLNNVLFIDVNPQKIEMLSSIDQSDIPYYPSSNTLLPQKERGSCLTGEEGLTLQGKTYTDTSTYISTNNSTDITTENTAHAINKNPLDKVKKNQPIEGDLIESTSNLPTLINGFKEEKEKVSQKRKSPVRRELTDPRTGEPFMPSESFKTDLWTFINQGRDGYWANKCKTPEAALKLATTPNRNPRSLLGQFLDWKESQPSQINLEQTYPDSPILSDW